MSKIINSEGVVLDYREFGEFDHLLVVFSKDFGKQEILLKGSKKTTSKLRFCLQRFMVMEYEVVKAKTFDRLIFFRTKFCFQSQDTNDSGDMQLYALYNVIFEILLKQLHFDQVEFEIYEESGVLEYWIVSPQDNTFFIYKLVDGHFVGSRFFV